MSLFPILEYTAQHRAFMDEHYPLSTHPHATRDTKYLVDDHGVVYSDRYGGIASSLDGDGTITLLPGHRFCSKAPYRCGCCGTDRLQCFRSDAYQTSVRCPDCQTTEVVHDG
jgi:hypothetical protein